MKKLIGRFIQHEQLHDSIKYFECVNVQLKIIYVNNYFLEEVILFEAYQTLYINTLSIGIRTLLR